MAPLYDIKFILMGISRCVCVRGCSMVSSLHLCVCVCVLDCARFYIYLKKKKTLHHFPFNHMGVELTRGILRGEDLISITTTNNP